MAQTRDGHAITEAVDGVLQCKGTAMARDEAYQIAEERIEAALKEGATELDLSGLGLTGD